MACLLRQAVCDGTTPPHTEVAGHAATEAHKAHANARDAYAAARAAGAPHDEVIAAHTRWVAAAFVGANADRSATVALIDAFAGPVAGSPHE